MNPSLISLHDIELQDTTAKFNADFIPHEELPPQSETGMQTREIASSLTTSKHSWNGDSSSRHYIPLIPYRRKRESHPTLPIGEQDIVVKIKYINERRDWNQAELLQYDNKLAGDIHALLVIKEKEKDKEITSRLASMIADIYQSVQRELKDKNEDLSVQYGLYASFWNLRATLTKG